MERLEVRLDSARRALPLDLCILRANLSVSLITEIGQESERIPEEAGKSFSC